MKPQKAPKINMAEVFFATGLLGKVGPSTIFGPMLLIVFRLNSRSFVNAKNS